MVNRKTTSLTADPRVRQVILDTATAQFPAEVTRLAQSMVAQGDPVGGASCAGVGKGSMNWSEEDLKALEIGVVGGFARGCHAGGITQFALLSAAGSSARSRIRYSRIMGLKEEAVQEIVLDPAPAPRASRPQAVPAAGERVVTHAIGHDENVYDLTEAAPPRRR